MVDNGDKGKEEIKIKKMCPFLGKWCIEDMCVLWMEVMSARVVLGIRQIVKGGACCMPSLAMIMSSRPQPQQGQRINLPNIHKG